ncbi:multidrug effflux MFS transporter [Agarivorans sp. QJM3NY_33]|uniref:multidrug effflux MFS transporter n=1 Tax=Agarivorans sp. QJM3NY_33 TaxID=3421432 RepID=UPI003D7E8968
MTNSSFNWKPVLLASLVVSIGQLSMGLVFPSLPWIAKDFSISVDEAQQLIAIYLLGFGPSQFIYGPVSDAIGRRKVLLFGLLLALLGLSVAVVGSQHFELLVLGRFIQGLGAGCCAVLGRASLRDSYSKDELPNALSWITVVASFTPIVAPVIGGFINHNLGWLSVFICLLCYISLVWVLLYFLFTETLQTKSALAKPQKIVCDYVELFRSRYFVSFAAINWLNFSLVVISVSLMPFIMQVQIGMTSEEYALWALIPASGLLTGSLICNRVRPKIGTKAMLFCSPVVHLCAAIWLIMAPLTPLAMMSGQFLMALGNGIALPCAMTLLLLPFKDKAGTVAALAGGCQMLFAALASMLLLKMGMHYAWHLGLVIGLFALLSSFNIYYGFKASPPKSKSEATVLSSSV